MRFTPTPGHVESLQDELTEALVDVWEELNIKKTSDWAAAGGFLGVGNEKVGNEMDVPLWTDEQLGLKGEKHIDHLNTEQGAIDDLGKERAIEVGAVA